MAEVVASKVRFIRGEGTEDSPYERVILEPGDKASNLPNDFKKELKEAGIIVDEKQLDENKNRIPGTVVVVEEEKEEKKPEPRKNTGSSGN